MDTAYRHIFFDLDKTLWDFRTNSREAISELHDMYLKNYEIDLENFTNVYERVNDYYWALYRDGKLMKKQLRNIRFEKTLEEFSCFDKTLASNIAEEYLRISPFKTNLMDGSISSLNYLKNKGYIIHIITNGFEEVQHIKIKESGLHSYVDVMVTSEQVGKRKPHKAVFEHALNRTGAKKHESLMIGDDLHADIIGARNFGMDQVYFNPDRIEHEEEITFEIEKIEEIKHLL